MTHPPYGERPREGTGRLPQPGWQPSSQGPGPAPHPASPPPGAPGYGGAAYGPPAHVAPGSEGPGHGSSAQPPPDGRRRATLLLLLAAVVLAVVAGVALLATATGPVVLSRSAVERDVAAQFEQREGVAVDLDCDQEMRVETGARYECTGVTADDEEVTLRIEITDADDARYTWSER
ncbi:DUF4333 domain-containing protein [Blastococcus sp. SYSU DS0669]